MTRRKEKRNAKQIHQGDSSYERVMEWTNSANVEHLNQRKRKKNPFFLSNRFSKKLIFLSFAEDTDEQKKAAREKNLKKNEAKQKKK